MNVLSIILIIGVVIGMYFFSGIKTVREDQRGILEKNGRFHRIISPGRVFVAPLLSKLYTIDVKEKLLKTSHPVTTKDGVTCLVSLNIYYKISDFPESIRTIFYDIHDYEKTILEHINAEIDDILSKYMLKDLSPSRLVLSSAIKNNTITLSKHYTITNIEITKVILPEEIQQSIHKIMTGENEKLAAQKLVEAEKIKIDGLKKIEKEKTESEKIHIQMRMDAQKKAIEQKAKLEAEAIEMIKQKADTSLKEITQGFKKIFDEAKEKSERKIKE